ncbi:peptidoglycan editing factor PgeF [Paraburkholderia bonniea]|uniref:peptidoglycan editing factor PgeF n=1 Tax=Paraburkholderia bonniea TaxID=2152891 RepID=UPI0012911D92|nr:peptidoglycan editing factor PgeF [Paraburkholderia bonniea]
MNELELTSADWLEPSWLVVPHVHALVTTRSGGVSLPPYGRWQDGMALPGGLNLGLRSGDDPAHVATNRARLQASLGGHKVAWLDQVHGAQIVRAEDALEPLDQGGALLQADASVTAQRGLVCAVLVADCMPVLLCDAAGRAVGAAHAGWRGLAAGIVEQTAQRVAALAGTPMETLHAYLGPSIGPSVFEVGAEVREVFLDRAGEAQRAATARAFVAHPETPGKYFASLPALARLRLVRAGVTQIAGGEHCTVTEQERFYSYRRDQVTGRMAALIWLAD